jgi:hypothetical protein
MDNVVYCEKYKEIDPKNHPNDLIIIKGIKTNAGYSDKQLQKLSINELLDLNSITSSYLKSTQKYKYECYYNLFQKSVRELNSRNILFKITKEEKKAGQGKKRVRMDNYTYAKNRFERKNYQDQEILNNIFTKDILSIFNDKVNKEARKNPLLKRNIENDDLVSDGSFSNISTSAANIIETDLNSISAASDCTVNNKNIEKVKEKEKEKEEIKKEMKNSSLATSSPSRSLELLSPKAIGKLNFYLDSQIFNKNLFYFLDDEEIMHYDRKDSGLKMSSYKMSFNEDKLNKNSAKVNYIIKIS